MMVITKYVKGGRDITHDIHYIAEHKVCRYGSNEEPKERMKKAIGGIEEMIREITNLYPGLKRISWARNYEKKETVVRVEFETYTQSGTEMTCSFKGGYKKILKEDPFTHELKTQIVPVGIQEHHMKAIFELERALSEYVRDGAGQMEFEFEVKQQEELVERATESLKVIHMQR